MWSFAYVQTAQALYVPDFHLSSREQIQTKFERIINQTEDLNVIGSTWPDDFSGLSTLSLICLVIE